MAKKLSLKEKHTIITPVLRNRRHTSVTSAGQSLPSLLTLGQGIVILEFFTRVTDLLSWNFTIAPLNAIEIQMGSLASGPTI